MVCRLCHTKVSINVNCDAECTGSYECVSCLYQRPELWKGISHMILENRKLDVYNVQNAEALVKGVTTAIMGQAQATKYRRHVLNHLVERSKKERCANATCKSRSGFQKWIECDNCLDWWHYTCAQITRKPVPFCCNECTRRIQNT